MPKTPIHDHWIEAVKQSKTYLPQLHLPTWTIPYSDFAAQLNLDSNIYPHLRAYDEKHTFKEKEQTFAHLGFTALLISPQMDRVRAFVTSSHLGDESLELAYIRGNRNAFALHIQDASDGLFVLLDYQTDGPPLRSFTLDTNRLHAEYRAKAKQAAAQLKPR